MLAKPLSQPLRKITFFLGVSLITMAGAVEQMDQRADAEQKTVTIECTKSPHAVAMMAQLSVLEKTNTLALPFRLAIS